MGLPVDPQGSLHTLAYPEPHPEFLHRLSENHYISQLEKNLNSNQPSQFIDEVAGTLKMTSDPERECMSLHFSWGFSTTYFNYTI